MKSNYEGKTVMVNIRPTDMAKSYDRAGKVLKVSDDKEYYIIFAGTPVLNGWFKDNDIAMILSDI